MSEEEPKLVIKTRTILRKFHKGANSPFEVIVLDDDVVQEVWTPGCGRPEPKEVQ